MSNQSDITVIKVGGSLGIDYDAVCDDIATLVQQGEKVVLVHGGSAETDRISTLLGHPPKTLTSASGVTSRRTDPETMDIFAMVYAGKMNTRIVERLQKRGVNTVGLSGLDGRLFTGERKKAIRAVEEGRQILIRDDLSGKVDGVNTDLIHLLIGAGYTLAISPPACSTEGEAINVDGDRAAAVLAGKLGAKQLIILSNVPGLLKNFPDESSLVEKLTVAQLPMASEWAEGRMKKKVMGAGEAIELGVKEVVFADARLANPIISARSGKGTVITP
jgi:acetylglutamate/LysW-gamma-L-alpha-aminoadipate kinase